MSSTFTANNLPIDTSGNTVTITDGTGGAAGGIYTITGTSLFFGEPLTAEETKELASLEEESLLRLKESRLKKFTEAPKHVREAIINNIKANMLTSEINSMTEQPISDRHSSLIDKKNRSTFIGGFSGGPFSIGALPEPIKLQLSELEAAHASASLEEEVLSE